MILHNILKAGERIEWDYVEDFGRKEGTDRGVISSYEVKNFCLTEEDGSYTMVIDPLYVVHTDAGITKYVLMSNQNIRAIED